MKIIFLDIDGVLNNHDRHPVLNYCTINKACAGRLNTILWATGAHIVLSSAWRYNATEGAMTLKGLQNLLLSHWVDGHRLIGFTERDEMLSCVGFSGIKGEHAKPEQRGERISEWLRKHGQPDRWIVLDDDPNCFTEYDRAELPIYFTDGKAGLTCDDVLKITEMLGFANGGA